MKVDDHQKCLSGFVCAVSTPRLDRCRGKKHLGLARFTDECIRGTEGDYNYTIDLAA
jgi:hypothetical protein